MRRCAEAERVGYATTSMSELFVNGATQFRQTKIEGAGEPVPRRPSPRLDQIAAPVSPANPSFRPAPLERDDTRRYLSPRRSSLRPALARSSATTQRRPHARTPRLLMRIFSTRSPRRRGCHWGHPGELLGDSRGSPRARKGSRSFEFAIAKMRQISPLLG